MAPVVLNVRHARQNDCDEHNAAKFASGFNRQANDRGRDAAGYLLQKIS